MTSSKTLFPGQGAAPWLIAFNRRLENASHPLGLTEKALGRWLAQLDLSTVPQNLFYWLTLARLTELALVCAGNYANSGEIQAVGDLLFNPRCVLVHIKGDLHPVRKARHRPLTEQFEHMADSRIGVIEWLKKKTVVEVKQLPILEDLSNRIQTSSFLSHGYIASIGQRLEKISECASYFYQEQTLLNQNRSMRSKSSISDSKKCRFSLDLFFEIGRAIDPDRLESRFSAMGSIVSENIMPPVKSVLSPDFAA